MKKRKAKGGCMAVMRISAIGKGALILGCILGLGASFGSTSNFSIAIFANDWDDELNPETYLSTLRRPHNFAHTAPTGKSYATWTDPVGNGPNKYTDYTLRNFHSTRNLCYDVITRQLNTSNPDTRIWAKTGSSAWQPVSDDLSSGVYQSTGRIWLPPNTAVTLRISAYSSASNSMDFKLVTHLMYETEFASCRNVSRPFVFATSAWPTVTNGN
jgi:hypothetical protein